MGSHKPDGPETDGDEMPAPSEHAHSISEASDIPAELPVSSMPSRHSRRQSLPVSIDAVPRLYRRSLAYSATSERAPIITIARTPSMALSGNVWDKSFAREQLEAAKAEAMERGTRSEADPDERENVDLEEPLLVEAHRVNHDTEAPEEPEQEHDLLSKRVSFAMNISLAANIFLLVVKIYAFYASKSKAILASAADSLVDIASQLVIAYAEYQVRKADPRFPIGRTRLETVGVVSCAVIMTLSTIEVIQSAAGDLWDGLHGDIPTLDMGLLMYAILGTATGMKFLLWLYCVALQNTSDSMMALAEDHRNDILSNVTAIACGIIGSMSHRFWWVDPTGAILISLYIIWSWGTICKNQVEKIVGKGAPEGFIGQLESLANGHHDQLEVDVIRAYYFGSRFIVELEVVMPAHMTVQESHDIAIVLQHKVEGFDEVERAFVHVDYARRAEPEHKVERNLLHGGSNVFESYDSFNHSNPSHHGSLEHDLSGNLLHNGSSSNLLHNSSSGNLPRNGSSPLHRVSSQGAAS